MRTRGAKYLAILAGSAAFGGLSLLTQCGGSSGGTGSPTEPDSEAPEAAVEGGEPGVDSGGPDATVDTGTDDASDATVSDAGSDADASLVDASADSGPPADSGLDAIATEDAADGAILDGGTEASSLVPCDVDAQADAADAQTCVGPATAACCGGFCIDTARDPRNCGQCGVVCTPHQFCTGVQCDDAVLANVCGNPSATVVLDPYPPDNEGGAAIGAGLAANCTPPTTVVQVNADAGNALDPTTGRPITGVGNTSVTGGGAYGQPGISYLDTAGLSPLYLYVNGNEYDIVQRSTGNDIVPSTFTAITAQHDYFFVEMVVEPQSGTLSLAGVGMLSQGTLAAGYYIGSVIIPNRASYPNAWYVYQWDDTNQDSIPNAGDTYTQIASGND
jgi:hypothetical protein